MVAIMERIQLVFIICIVTTVQVYVSASACNVPSRFWCDSEEVASACGVYEQCRKYEWTLRQDVDQVNFALYYESLCPGCKSFITNQLYPTYMKISAIEKQVDNRWQFKCQHGPEECDGNIITTCTIALVKNISVYLPFLNCMESSRLLPRQAAQQCSLQFPVPLAQILNCTESDYGNQLEHEMALKTGALIPKHRYVPWVTLNGVHTDAIEQEALTNLLKLLCDAYKGQKPPACQKIDDSTDTLTCVTA